MDVDSKSQARNLANNIEGLRAIGSDLADRLANFPADQIIPLWPGAKGLPTARIRCEDGCEVLLTSERDPLAEARRWVASLGDLGEKHTVVVVGLGLGYHVLELLHGRRGGLVVVLEPSLAMLHAALRCQDFLTDILLLRLAFVVAEQRTELFAPLMGHNVELMLGSSLAQHAVSGRAWPTACSQLQRSFTEYLHFVRSALTTTLEISAASADNVLRNLPYYVRWPGIEALKDKWKGRPGFCVSAGPSLRKNMHWLKQIKGRAPILAVQTTLKPLLAAGIRPDIVTALDYSALSQRFYEGLEGLDDITLVADAKVHPIVPSNYPGPVRMYYNSFVDLLLEEMGDHRDMLPAGSTVAHLNLYLARYMGCDPIVLIGQDLGFAENVYYAPGTAIHTVWSAELNRFNTLEMMEWQRVVRMRSTLRKVAGQDGRQIYTDGQMFTYIQQFERDIAETSAKVVNATEGGAHLEGSIEMPLAEVVARYCPDDRGATPVIPPVLRPDAADRSAEAVRHLRTRLDELDQMEEICEKVLEPLRQMPDALKDRAKFNRLHAEMDLWRVKIDSLERVYRLVSDVTQLAEMKRFQMDNALRRKDLDEIAQRREQLTRDILYVSLLREGVEVLRQSVRASLDLLEGRA